MTMMTKTPENKCRKCGKTLTGSEKAGLCPDCVERLGTRVAIGGAGALSIVAIAVKNKGKITKGAGKAIKVILSIVKH